MREFSLEPCGYVCWVFLELLDGLDPVLALLRDTSVMVHHPRALLQVALLGCPHVEFMPCQ